MADEALAGIGELVFSLVIGYLGALEFIFVARQLYHWTSRHPDSAGDAQELPRLRDRLDNELAEAAARELAAGSNVMQDGVAYSNGFRVDPAQLNPVAADKRAALQAELERQQRIEEETRKQLAEAEAKLAKERRMAEEEAAESARKLLAAEKQREAAQREREENGRKLIEAEQQREAEENERKLRESEQRKEAEQREREENERKLRAVEEQKEAEENERKLAAAEKQRLAAERERELAEAEDEAAENERRLFEAESEREAEQALRDAEIVERLLAAERERKLSATESELEEEAAIAEQARRLLDSKTQLENKQKLIEENARLFLEAEEEMVVLQQRMLSATQESDYAGQTPVVEEPCVKKTVAPKYEEPAPIEEEPLVVHKVKTQFGQQRSKTLTFPGVSDEGSSIEPNSSQQSSFSTQPSEELTADALRLHLESQEQRQEPDGEDNVPDVQYTEEYLRSLDGIKGRSLMREDGSGRRRAFKKRRSSGSSNSSRDSRTSREEEVKMFTSLEEEELKQGNKEDYNPIKYSSEPTLRVKSQHRRHKRSPAKDVKPSAGDSAGSLEMLGEESTNPWGEIIPEHYKDTEFWKREKALSIDEEELELEKHASGEELVESEAANNVPKASSFEEANEAQNHEAAKTLQSAKEEAEKDSKAADISSGSSDTKSNLQTSSTTESQSRNSSPGGLRRSPRIDEIDHYEQRWSEADDAAKSSSSGSASSSQPPSISVQQPDTAPWRDQYGLLMEGLSDFYDFTASTNPSRSRSTSRNPSPQPKNVANRMDVDSERSLEVYDDTDNLLPGELNCELVLELLEATMNENDHETVELQLQNVADDEKNRSSNQIVPMVLETMEDAAPNALLQTLREDRCRSRSRSRSRSPLPTTEQLEKSINTRRERLIKHNDELFEMLSSGRSSPMEVETNGDAEHKIKSHSSSNSPLPQPIIEINEMISEPVEEMEDNSPEQMRLFVETLRAERNSRSRSRSRSRSPLPSADNIERSLESRRLKRIQQNDELYEQLNRTPESESHPNTINSSTPAPPTISIEYIEAPVIKAEEEQEPVDTPESMARLFEQLRLNRSRSHSRCRSKSPLPSAANLEQSLENRRQKLIAHNDDLFDQLQERAKTPEPPRLTVEYVYEFVEAEEEPADSRDARSLSPSRSRSTTPEDIKDFHLMLNLEGSLNKTLSKNSEEFETVLAAKQRELDLEALRQLTNASEEVELRVLSPMEIRREALDQMAAQSLPDYDRTVSEVARDIKDELVASGFKRSTYVGESLDMGSEFEQLRREAAGFQRSHSPSPSIEDLDVAAAQSQAAAQRELQAAILDSLATASAGQSSDEKRLGAKPKTNEYERSFSDEVKDTQRMKEESLSSGFKRSTYVGESVDLSAQLDDLRHRTAEFQRSRSQSRSPLADDQVDALRNIEAEVAKRELQDQLLDQLAASNFQNFSRHLNADFLDSERRASDSLLMQSDPYADLEPDEYHHFRRYSLAQEQPVEEYPSDDDYVYISQVEVRTLTGTRTWLKEDFYSQDMGSFELDFSECENMDKDVQPTESSESVGEEGSWDAAEFDATNAIYNFDIVADYEEQRAGNYDDNSDDSEDERQTVVEIEDEFDEGISDYNERGGGPTDESHHDTSECEEAERNADRYANRDANDWQEVEDVDDFLDYSLDDGAVGGVTTPYSDPDSFIEQIYNEAVKNRKQSGILRDYESILQEQLPTDNSESDKEKSSSSSSSKNRAHERQEEAGLGPRRDTEMRYLGDAQVMARQSTRLRTRYGFNPQLQVGDIADDDVEVDLNYKPKREYNWRKNFKLDDSEQNEAESAAAQMEAEGAAEEAEELAEHQDDEIADGQELDPRRYSFGGESITLFSRSPERELLSDVPEETMPEMENAAAEPTAELLPSEDLVAEKPKKKKSKKKSRKGSKTEEELRELDNDSDTQLTTTRRRSGSMANEDIEAELPKRKSRSRRSSKSSLNNEEGGGLFSPRSSIGFVGGDALAGIAEMDTAEGADSAPQKKKTKKRKKAKEESQALEECADEQHLDEALAAALAEIAPVSVSAQLTPASTQENLLANISSGQSICATPASSAESSIAQEPPVGVSSNVNNVTTNASSNVVAARSVVDSFDILKDANFYPLF